MKDWKLVVSALFTFPLAVVLTPVSWVVAVLRPSSRDGCADRTSVQQSSQVTE